MQLLARWRAASPKLAQAYGVVERCLVASFDAEFLQAHARDRLRTSPRAISSITPWRCPAPGQPTPLFPPVDAVGPRRGPRHARRFSRRPRPPRLPVHPWTVDEPEEIRRLLAAGVASITTNAPDVALEVRAGAEPRDTGLALSGGGSKEA